MESGGKNLRIKLYKCGYCTNHLRHMFWNTKDKVVEFPAFVALIVHPEFGNILFDTGYSKRVYEYGLISKLYNLLNPTKVTEEETIASRLHKEGIEAVSHIILSHPHPDHIGGLRDFEGYTLWATKDTLGLMEQSNLMALVFQNQLPDFTKGTVKQQAVVPMEEEHFLKLYFSEVYDLFGDQSIIGVRLDGHSKGQMGIYIAQHKILLAADASWGNAYMEKVSQMKPIPRMIQNDFKTYVTTVEAIQRLQEEHGEIKVLFSHDSFEEQVYE